MSRLRLRACIPFALGLLACACGSPSASDVRGQVLVVDAQGTPIQGALVVPDPEFPPAEAPRYTASEIKERSTDAQGMVSVYLDDFYWNADGCFHVRVRRDGYEDESMTVSRDLMPTVLKIDLRPKASATPAAPGRRS